MKLALLAGLAAVLSFGQSRFEVISVKPNAVGGADMQGNGDVRLFPGGRLVAEKAQLRYFIQNAYDLKPFQVLGGPGWINSAHFDIEAKAGGNPSTAEMRRMMQSLLADRFGMQSHSESREMPVYEISMAKGGVKLQPPKEGGCAPGPCGRLLMTLTPTGARILGGNVKMAELVRILSNVMARIVIDKTGYAESFDVRLEFAPDNTLAGLPTLPPTPDATGASLFRSLQDQLGLKLESARGAVEVLVIDQIARPGEN